MKIIEPSATIIEPELAGLSIGPHDDPDPTGWRNYEVRINCEVIATFRHRRDHGLARCLRMAAAAVEDVRAKELQA